MGKGAVKLRQVAQAQHLTDSLVYRCPPFVLRHLADFLNRQVHALFELVNAKGKIVTVLGVSPSDGGVLLIYDRKGTLRVAIGMITEGNAAINLNDGNGNQRVTISVKADGSVVTKGF